MSDLGNLLVRRQEYFLRAPCMCNVYLKTGMSKIQPQASGTRIAQIRTASWTERPQDLAIDMFIFLGMCKLC